MSVAKSQWLNQALRICILILKGGDYFKIQTNESE